MSHARCISVAVAARTAQILMPP